MKMKLKKSIGFKMAVAMAAGLFVVISLFSHTNVRLSEERLLAMAEKEASKMSNAIKSSLDDAMLANELGKVQTIVEAVGQESMVQDIKVIALDGEVRMAKNKAEIGKHLDRQEKSCLFCHKTASVQRENLTELFEKEDGTRILRNVNPIDNDKRCHGCHDPGMKVLGKLLIDFTTQDIDAMVTDNRKLLILSAVATLLASIVICVLVSTVLVKRPLHALLAKMKMAESEGGSATDVVEGEDEVALLDETYEAMMKAIDSRNRTIREQMEEHQALFHVSEILNRSDSIDENVDLILQALSIGFKVEECAVVLFDEIGGLKSKGLYGMSEEKGQATMACLGAEESVARVNEGETFVLSDPSSGVEDFLVVPLKAARKIIGAITVHRVRDREIHDESIRSSFAIVATSIAPHFHIGLAQEEKMLLKVSPFNAFVESVANEIERVREYMGSLSLAVLRVEGYDALCGQHGVQAASNLVQDLGVGVSSALTVVHENFRTAADTVAVLLPMIDKLEATEKIGQALAQVSHDLVVTFRIATYPEDGEIALDLLFAARDVQA